MDAVESQRCQTKGSRTSSLPLDPDRLSRAIAAAGVTPERLAKDAEVDRKTVFKALAGEPLRMTSVLKIANAVARYKKHPAIVALLPDGPEDKDAA